MDLVDIEREMKVHIDRQGIGFNSERDKVSMIELEARNRSILCDQEKEARQKSRVLWLLCGDHNTLFSISMLLIGKILTPFGKLRMIRVI